MSIKGVTPISFFIKIGPFFIKLYASSSDDYLLGMSIASKRLVAVTSDLEIIASCFTLSIINISLYFGIVRGIVE